ncbi:hypothetical protein [Clostridium botulinum]|uniref:Uncharacterized protein n=2 Tax=Clostridium botulinum TaxID=1491 RepID=A0A9Q1UYA6_CLOBO|nr:hypothetical protein [Clostridium botulinum]AEB75888.1 putative hypothetical protein [Clostridium botulinum BKT015925]KEH97201.1 hypothetical protein Z953_02605 [Clostridium botulinum D str. 16868]KEI04689.1 hypothetical protein Y848_00545 [Clostridium botulinum C/D str. Sp77]KLU76760.1 hypothetical protein CBC3_01835 [Clostridium botulinum V891]KOA75213.1 hypothetical protein ADU78_08475 [Clostridium botulinum]
MFEKILEPEMFKNIITLIIIPLLIKIYNNIPIKARRKLKWDESNEEKKMWSNYFPPLVAMIILEFSYIYIQEQIEILWFRVLIYSVFMIVIFCIEFIISTFWYLNFKYKNEYLRIKHMIHLIFAIDSIILCFVVETSNKCVCIAYIIITLIACILHICLILKCNKNNYKKLKYIKMEFQDGTTEKNIIDYEQHKKCIILFISSSSQRIIKKTFYGAKIKKKIEIYY